MRWQPGCSKREQDLYHSPGNCSKVEIYCITISPVPYPLLLRVKPFQWQKYYQRTKSSSFVFCLPHALSTIDSNQETFRKGDFEQCIFWHLLWGTEKAKNGEVVMCSEANSNNAYLLSPGTQKTTPKEWELNCWRERKKKHPGWKKCIQMPEGDKKKRENIKAPKTEARPMRLG